LIIIFTINQYFFEVKLEQNLVTDFGNSLFYQTNVKDKNSINLLVFADGITFRKSKSSSMVAKLSSIVELPPLLRSKYENIITHFLICKSNPNLEAFFERNSQDLFSIFDSKINLPRIGKQVKINIIAIVADLIEIPKLLNVMQFNANEGACLQCFIKPQKIVQGIYFLY
jgi:hypothetical protein